jgi:hypothetical protein
MHKSTIAFRLLEQMTNKVPKMRLTTSAQIAAILMLAAVFSSCNNDVEKNGLIVIDPNTNKQYLLKHNVGDTYFIYERVAKIVGKDTTWTFTK